MVMTEVWLTENEPLISLGFAGTYGMVIYIPLNAFRVPTERLTEEYHSKVIIKRIATGKMIPVDIPVVKRDNKPWGKWRITKSITAQSGLISFQYRAVNEVYRLLTSKMYRAIIFDAIGDTQSKEVVPCL